MKKIGIVSLYYKNRNYGGLLQAYALTKFISKTGYDVEQLCWEFFAPKFVAEKRIFKLKKIFRYIKTIINIYFMKWCHFYYDKKFALRNCAFEEFQNKISHSKKIYNKNNVADVSNDYDAIIIGSDQVWNISWYNDEYFLNDVSSSVYKFSYAASMPDINITEEQKEMVRASLKNFSDISVREQSTADFLSELIGENIKCVVDPTMLLEREDWDNISSERLIKEKYIFCYFLGKDRNIRKQAKIFAKKVGLKIVTLPHVGGINREDMTFGDYKLFDIGPQDFVALIKHSEYVLTDSFHAAVFSNIYETKYFVFDRKGISMNERIITLLNMFNSRERFLKPDAKKMYEMKDIPVTDNIDKYKIVRDDSIKFLLGNLGKWEKVTNGN